MAKRIKLTLTEEHISLIKNFMFDVITVSHPEQSLGKNIEIILKKLDELEKYKVSKIKDFDDFDHTITIIRGQMQKILSATELSQFYAENDKTKYFGMDTYNLFNADTIDFVARLIGCYDKVIPGTEEDFDGPKFPEEIDIHIHEICGFVMENLKNIEELIHQRCDKGGIQPNVTYICYDNEHLWFTEEEFEEHRKKK